MDNNLSVVLDEITSLKSIFPENVLTIDEKQLNGRFSAEVVLNSNQLVFYRTDYTNNDCNSGDNCRTEAFCVQHLPPIELYFEITKDYPSERNPKFIISCNWLTLSQLELIGKKLEDMWKESKSEILFNWFTFLQNEAIDCLGINTELDISFSFDVKSKQNSKIENVINSGQNIVLEKTYYRNINEEKVDFQYKNTLNFSSSDQRVVTQLFGDKLIQHLKTYDEYKRKDILKKSYILCNICLSTNLGEDCVVFPCDHIHCKPCIRDYFTSLVIEGNVYQLKCPETECQSSAPADMVRELIPEEHIKRYDKLLSESVIAGMSEVYYCPRKGCGNVVIGESNSSLAHCQSCGYAFCKNCELSYHGLDPCQLSRNTKQMKAILEEYMEASDAEKLKLENIYGKTQLDLALEKWRSEEAANDKWLEEKTKNCPICWTSTEKNGGSNKIVCWRCDKLKKLATLYEINYLNTAFDEITKIDQATKIPKLLSKVQRRISEYTKKFAHEKDTSYLKKWAKKCPNCKVLIEKDGGCRRMYCLRCVTPFCWDCLLQLPSDNAKDRNAKISYCKCPN